MTSSASLLHLGDLPIGHAATVHGLHCPPEQPDWQRWLEEIGFLPGERVAVMARALPGGDPLVVRVGASSFALRRAEADCVRVMAVPAPLTP